MLSSALDLLGGGASRPSRWQVGMQSGARSGASCVEAGGRGTGWSCGNAAYLKAWEHLPPLPPALQGHKHVWDKAPALKKPTAF